MAEVHGRVSGRDAGRYRGQVSPGARGLPSLHGLLLGRRAEVPEDHGEPRTRGIDDDKKTTLHSIQAKRN